MARIVSDHSRRWFPATRRFRPDPPSDVALALFWRETGRRMGLTRGEAGIVYHHCRGVTSDKELAALRGCALNTLKNAKTRLFDRLGWYGNYQTTRLVLTFWPLYQEARRAAALVQTIEEDTLARLSPPGAQNLHPGAAADPGDPGPPGGLRGTPDQAADCGG